MNRSQPSLLQAIGLSASPDGSVCLYRAATGRLSPCRQDLRQGCGMRARPHEPNDDSARMSTHGTSVRDPDRRGMESPPSHVPHGACEAPDPGLTPFSERPISQTPARSWRKHRFSTASMSTPRDARLRGCRKHAVRLVVGRGRHLRDARFFAFRAAADQVGEGASDADGVTRAFESRSPSLLAGVLYRVTHARGGRPDASNAGSRSPPRYRPRAATRSNARSALAPSSRSGGPFPRGPARERHRRRLRN